VRGAVDLLQLADGDVAVDLSGLQIGVAQHGLDEADVGAAFEHQILRFATALGSQHRGSATAARAEGREKPSRKVLRRLEQIEKLPARRQMTLLRTIDTFLENSVLKSAGR
jgi:hypothetical protein